MDVFDGRKLSDTFVGLKPLTFWAFEGVHVVLFLPLNWKRPLELLEFLMPKGVVVFFLLFMLLVILMTLVFEFFAFLFDKRALGLNSWERIHITSESFLI